MHHQEKPSMKTAPSLRSFLQFLEQVGVGGCSRKVMGSVTPSRSYLLTDYVNVSRAMRMTTTTELLGKAEGRGMGDRPPLTLHDYSLADYAKALRESLLNDFRGNPTHLWVHKSSAVGPTESAAMLRHLFSMNGVLA